MGMRGEVFSTKLVKNDRTYFFNVKENIYGDMFLNIVESKGTPDEGRFIRQSVIIYQEDLGEFVKEFQRSLDFIKQNDKSTKPFRPERRFDKKDEKPGMGDGGEEKKAESDKPVGEDDLSK